MKAKFEWERIHYEEMQHATFRAMVPGGWLVNHIIYPCDQESLMVMTTTFAPDSQHQWVIEPSAPTIGTAMRERDNLQNPIVQHEDCCNYEDSGVEL